MNRCSTGPADRSSTCSFSALQWLVDAYALALAAALLLSIGGLADLIRHRRVYVAGLSLFALSSLVGGLAPDAAVLIGARAALRNRNR